MRVLRPCKTTAAYECLPERELRWVLDAAERKLVARGWGLVVNAAVMLIVRKDVGPVTPGPTNAAAGQRGVECSLYASGKVLLKTRDAGVARTAVEALLSDLEEPEALRVAERAQEAA